MLIISLLAGIIISFGIPMAGFFILRRKKEGMGKVFCVGMLAFTISQVCVRIPILTAVLPNFAWFSILQLYPWLYVLFLGLTAGIFEEGARWLAMKYLLKERDSFEDGLSFGLGHGGIEAILFVGVNHLAILGMILIGKGDDFLISANEVWLAAIERVFAIIFHVGASLLVMYGVKNKKSIRYLGLAILLHTVLNMGVILPLAFNTGMAVVEIYAAVVASITLWAGCHLFLRTKSKQEEVI